MRFLNFLYEKIMMDVFMKLDINKEWENGL